MFKNMRLSFKLITGFGMLLLLLAIIIGVYYFALNTSVQRYTSLIASEIQIKQKART